MLFGLVGAALRRCVRQHGQPAARSRRRAPARDRRPPGHRSQPRAYRPSTLYRVARAASAIASSVGILFALWIGNVLVAMMTSRSEPHRARADARTGASSVFAILRHDYDRDRLFRSAGAACDAALDGSTPEGIRTGAAHAPRALVARAVAGRLSGGDHHGAARRRGAVCQEPGDRAGAGRRLQPRERARHRDRPCRRRLRRRTADGLLRAAARTDIEGRRRRRHQPRAAAAGQQRRRQLDAECRRRWRADRRGIVTLCVFQQRCRPAISRRWARA